MLEPVLDHGSGALMVPEESPRRDSCFLQRYFKIDDQDHVADISFEGEGCTISQAGGSIVTERAKGLTLDAIKELGLPEITDEMGDDIIRSRVRCATLALGTFQAAGDQFRRDRERREAGLPPIVRPAFEV